MKKQHPEMRPAMSRLMERGVMLLIAALMTYMIYIMAEAVMGRFM